MRKRKENKCTTMKIIVTKRPKKCDDFLGEKYSQFHIKYITDFNFIQQLSIIVFELTTISLNSQVTIIFLLFLHCSIGGERKSPDKLILIRTSLVFQTKRREKNEKF